MQRMTEFEIFKDKQKLLTTFLKYDDAESGCDAVLQGAGREAFESNTLLLHILLEIACRNVEDDPHKRQDLFLKMWNKLTEAKLTDELKFHMDALFSVRNQAVFEFEKELIKMVSKEISPSLSVFSSKTVTNDENLEMNSEQCPSLLNYLSKSQKLMKVPSIHLEKYRSEFEEMSRIGKGGFGTVWKAQHKIDGVCYAVKKVMFKYRKDSDFLKVISEVKSFATLNHFNVVGYNQAWLEYVVPSSENNSAEDFDSSLFEKLSSGEESHMLLTSGSINPFCHSFERENSERGPMMENTIDMNCSSKSSEMPLLRVMLYIQMECCDSDLRFWIDERSKGNPLRLTICDIFRDILSGVAHIHSKNIIHRDLKPQNIFYSAKNNCMKIGDFGLAALTDELNEKAVVNCGTMPYAAPEIRNNCKYDSKVDMYSLGVILFELLTESKTRMELSVDLEQIFSGTLPPQLQENWPQYVPLVKNLVSSDPAIRFSAEYILANLPVSTHSKKTLVAEIMHLRERLMEKEKRIEELEALLRFQTPAS